MPDAPAKLMSAPAPKPKGVAVVIAAWRAAGTIGRAVASALAQPEAAEVMVVDDASGDNGATLDAAKAADDGSGRLMIIALERNGGPARARNTAIAKTTSPWVCVLDSDDYFEPGRLGRVLAEAESRDFIADDLMQLPEGADRAAGKPTWLADGAGAKDISLEAFALGNVAHPARPRGELGFAKPLMSRAFLDRHNLRYDEGLRLGEDFDLYARALAAGARFRLVPYAGYISVIRETSLSARHSRDDLAAQIVAEDRMITRPGLTSAERAAFRARRFSNFRKMAWIDFMDALKARRLARAAGIVLGEPRLTPYLLSGLGRIAMKRLSGTKKTGAA